MLVFGSALRLFCCWFLINGCMLFPQFVSKFMRRWAKQCYKFTACFKNNLWVWNAILSQRIISLCFVICELFESRRKIGNAKTTLWLVGRIMLLALILLKKEKDFWLEKNAKESIFARAFNGHMQHFISRWALSS